jgi:SAM-dependent methyltransferase
MSRLGFGGEVAELYAPFRRGYPPAVVDIVAGHFGLTCGDVVVDLGCGTGQLALPISRRVGAVIGVDREPDMLVQARRAAEQRHARNLLWIVGSDRDVQALGRVLGHGRLAAVLIGQALHWMRPESLFGVLAGLVRPGGGVAVVTNGTRSGCRRAAGLWHCGSSCRHRLDGSWTRRAAPTRPARRATAGSWPTPASMS